MQVHMEEVVGRVPMEEVVGRVRMAATLDNREPHPPSAAETRTWGEGGQLRLLGMLRK